MSNYVMNCECRWGCGFWFIVEVPGRVFDLVVNYDDEPEGSAGWVRCPHCSHISTLISVAEADLRGLVGSLRGIWYPYCVLVDLDTRTPEVSGKITGALETLGVDSLSEVTIEYLVKDTGHGGTFSPEYVHYLRVTRR
jgi:hypothetical protein